MLTEQSENQTIEIQRGSSKPFCSFQDNLQASEYRRDRRLNGIQLPLHPLQLIGWIALLGFGLATFLVLIPGFHPKIQQPLFGLLSGLYIIHSVSHLAALLLDPADSELRKISSNKIVPEFDRTKHYHVIENGRCHLCNIKTTSNRTKHCSVCNKCIGKFDHHCKWLNHCVGGRNYVAFLMCVVSAVIAALVILAAVIAQIVLYHVEPDLLNLSSDNINLTINKINSTNETDFNKILNHTIELINNSTENVIQTGIGFHDTIFLIFIAILGILAAITAGLLLHLCFFHIYISFLGLTTYEYIRNHRQNVMSTVPPTNATTTTTTTDPSVTTITPSIITTTSTTTTTPSTTLVSDTKSPKFYFCSTKNSTSSSNDDLNELTNHRPKSLHCCDTSREYHQNTHKSYYVCSMLEESSGSIINGENAHTFHCCSEYHQTTNDNDVETAVHYTEQCTFCSFKIKTPSKSETISLQDKRCCLKSITKHHRWRRKWNCCSNVPDSPDVPGDPLRTISSEITIQQQHFNGTKVTQIPTNFQDSTPRLITTNGSNGNGSSQSISPQQRTAKILRPRLVRPWPVARFRHMLRMIGNRRPRCRHGIQATAVKQNQVRPLQSSSDSNSSIIQLERILPTSAIRCDDSSSDIGVTLPILPPPSRRKIRNPTDLQELADTLDFAQQPVSVRFSSNPSFRRQRRKNFIRNRSPTLSPIHESGLSNPTSPQPCRHSNCSGSISTTIGKSNVCGTTNVNQSP